MHGWNLCGRMQINHREHVSVVVVDCVTLVFTRTRWPPHYVPQTPGATLAGPYRRRYTYATGPFNHDHHCSTMKCTQTSERAGGTGHWVPVHDTGRHQILVVECDTHTHTHTPCKSINKVALPLWLATWRRRWCVNNKSNWPCLRPTRRSIMAIGWLGNKYIGSIWANSGGQVLITI